jgi:predicted dehydrogenase
VTLSQPRPTRKSVLSTPAHASTPSKSPVKVALFGVGRWGNHLLRNFLTHPNAELVAVADPAAERLNTLAHQHQLDQQQITVTSDWQAALHLPNVEAVVIATPAATHYAMIRAALERGCHVLAEKPLTLSVMESLELCQLAEQQQCQLIIDHTYLFHPAVQQGRSVIQQGAIGDLRYGYAARTHLGPVRQDVDALWDLAIHDIAIFNHWLNEIPVQVQAGGAAWLQSGLADVVWAKLFYGSGFQATIHLCWANPDKQRRLSVVGSKGALVFDELAASPLTLLPGQLNQQDGQFVPCPQPQQALTLEAIEPLQAVCTHFLDCVQLNRPSEISSGWLGTDLVKILVALTQSLAQQGVLVSL